MKYLIITIILFTLFFLLHMTRGIITLDSDFGWHIRMGQIILKTGIPKTDPLSYTMPSYPFVDHEWLTNVIIATLYPRVGMIGLAILYAALVVGAVVIQIPRTMYRQSALIIILISGALFSISGVRTQLATWFLFSFMISILSLYATVRWYRYLLIPLMIIWVNLHGAFPLGLVLMGIFFTIRSYEQKKIQLEDACVFIASIAVTFINPYGLRIWWEVWQQVSDHSLHWSILEWLPSFFFLNIALWMYIVISVTLTGRYRRRFTLYQQVTYILFLLAGISAYRHMPLWIIVSIYPTLLAMQFFEKEVTGYLYGKQRLRKFYLILIAIAVLSAAWEMGWYFTGTNQNRETTKYPKQAVHFIKQHLPPGRIFTLYEWGGYFDWKLPEKKVFIDGRMPSFRWKSPNTKESDYIFKEYQKAIYGKKKDFMNALKKYHIEMVVVPKRTKYEPGIFDTTLEKILRPYIQPPPKKKQEDKFADLQLIYQDDIALVYRVQK